MGKISRFGLMELSRQRLRPALAETSYISCPRCTGTGHIRSTESAALHILRILEEEAMKENTGAVHVQVPVDVATFLLNEKRPDIQAIESRHKATILLIPNIHLETPAHTITRLRHDDLNGDEIREPSYKMVDAPIEEAIKLATQQEAVKPRQEAVIKGVSPEKPAPILPEKTVQAPALAPAEAETGLISKILSWFRTPPQAVEPVVAPEPAKKPREVRKDGRRERSDGRDNRRGGRNSNNRGSEEAGEQSPSNERGERPERSNRNERNVEKAPREESTAANGERPERRPRGERKERQRPQQETAENKLMPEAVADIAASVTPLGVTEGQEAGSGDEQAARRRGRRGGRGRSERRNEAEGSATETGAQESSTPLEAAAPLINQEPVIVIIPAPVAATPAPVVEVIAPSIEITPVVTPVVETAAIFVPIVEVAPIVTPVVEAAPVVAPIVVEAIEAAPVAVIETVEIKPATVDVVESREIVAAPPVVAIDVAVAKPIDLEKTLAESGLMMVQTTSAAVIAQPEAPMKLGRPRKAKSPVDQADAEPLVSVETTK